MILRTSHGRTRAENAAAYERFLRVRAMPDYTSVDGLERAIFTKRDEAEVAHFLLVTIWRDIAAVQAFAGRDPGRAKCYPEDDRFLLEKEDAALSHRVFCDSSDATHEGP